MKKAEFRVWLVYLRKVFLMIVIEIYNDIHSKLINIGLPTDPLLEDGVLCETTLLVGETVDTIAKSYAKRNQAETDV